MNILHPDIQEFIGQIKKLNDIGCLRVPRNGMKRLIGMLATASVIIGPKPIHGRVTYYQVSKKTDLDEIKAPAVLIIAEEDFSDAVFADRIRDKAAYFMQVKPVIT